MLLILVEVSVKVACQSTTDINGYDTHAAHQCFYHSIDYCEYQTPYHGNKVIAIINFVPNIAMMLMLDIIIAMILIHMMVIYAVHQCLNCYDIHTL